MSHEPQENKALRFIKDNWAILMFIGGLVVTWANFNTAINQSKADIAELKTHTLSIDTNQNAILTQLSQIQTDLSWIKRNINVK